jgi:adenylyl-sulfate kinase
MKVKSGVIWFTGISGAGKTTLAKALIPDLKKNNVNPVFLDGNEVRMLFQNHGFYKKARQKYNIEIGKMASFFEKQGHVVIVSLISPFTSVRNEVRQICENYTEIYEATSLKTCIARDTKGLYQKAINGEILEFTGIYAPYEASTKAEVELNTENHTVNECIKIN